MKILEQNQAYVQKNNERKALLDEGLKIAQKVDDVRMTLAKEELTLRKFKEETTKIVQKEIDELISKKNELQREVDILNRQADTLKKPFDEEWELIKMKRLNELDEKLYELESREDSISKKEYNFSFKENDILDAERRVIDQDKRTADALEKARNEENEAHELLNNAKIREAQIQSEIDAKLKTFNEKESQFISRERDIDIREEALRRSVAELVKRERFINDKYNTLLRTEKAVKK